MSVFGEAVSSVVSGVVSPITGLLAKKEERKQAHEAAITALNSQKEADTTQVTIEQSHLETIMAQANQTSWKDEYVTVSLVGIINVVMLGGILHGFGYPAFLDGVVTGVQMLSQLFDLKIAMSAVIGAAIGIRTFKTLF
jgi:hypothetical protein